MFPGVTSTISCVNGVKESGKYVHTPLSACLRSLMLVDEFAIETTLMRSLTVMGFQQVMTATEKAKEMTIGTLHPTEFNIRSHINSPALKRSPELLDTGMSGLET